MIHYKSKAEVELMRESSLLVSKTLALVAGIIKPGMTTLHIDTIAETFIKDNKASASFKGYNGFPFACCISVNDAVVHGFPSKNELKEGDIVSVDVGVFKNGFHVFSTRDIRLNEKPTFRKVSSKLRTIHPNDLPAFLGEKRNRSAANPTRRAGNQDSLLRIYG